MGSSQDVVQAQVDGPMPAESLLKRNVMQKIAIGILLVAYQHLVAIAVAKAPATAVDGAEKDVQFERGIGIIDFYVARVPGPAEETTVIRPFYLPGNNLTRRPVSQRSFFDLFNHILIKGVEELVA